jgi:serine/threonine protein kinase
MPLRPGETFGRYELAEPLGRGAMGAVYCAYDTLLRRKVALKVLIAAPGTPDDGAAPGGGGGARILREARAAAGITHPNAVSIYDVGEVDGVPFLAMELVAGRTMRGIIGDANIPLARRVRWLADTARALGAAHTLGVIHRDIKPENIMVRDDGLVKVLDFGIARRGTDRAGARPEVARAPPLDLAELERLAIANRTLTADGLVVGTPMYMAPEQMLGEAIDGRTDQFAWGVLAHELLTGRLPWEGSGLTMLSQLLSKEVAPLTEGFPEIPPGVDAVVRRALSKAPAGRFATMEDAADELEHFAGSSGSPSARAGHTSARGTATLASSLHLVTWENVVGLVDYGQATAYDYVALEELITAEAARHAAGIGGLIFVPAKARPPSESARAAMHELMQRLGSSMRGICWVVEGAGFQGAMVRAVLTGVRFVRRLPYESHVSGDPVEALRWLVQQLDGSDARVSRVPEGIGAIQEQRRRSEAERPPPGK